LISLVGDDLSLFYNYIRNEIERVTELGGDEPKTIGLNDINLESYSG